MVCIIPHSPTSNLEREVVCIKASQDQIFRQSFIPCCLFLQKLSGDCQLHQKYSCWLRWLIDYHQVRLLLSESNVLVNSAQFRSANIIQHWLVGLHPFTVLSSVSIVQHKLGVVTFSATVPWCSSFDPSCAVCLNHVCVRQEHLPVWDLIGEQLIETLMWRPCSL